MKTKILPLLYFTVGLAFIILEQLDWFIPGLVLKGLIIPTLMVLYHIRIKNGYTRFHRSIMGGLFLSWAGDILLELSQKNDNYFLLGLACFLMAQVLYLAAFLSTPGPNAATGKKVYLLAPIVLYGLGLILFLYQDLGNMKVPVIVYALVILCMLGGAVNRLEKVNRSSFYLVLAGAILFVLSDSLIAVNKFSHPFVGASVVIMSMYLMAQYLIVTGCIRQTESSA